MEIVWRVSALNDLEAIREFIGEENPGAAARTQTAIRSAVDRLAQFPRVGREGRVEGTRELVIPNVPYIVAYRIAENEVRILAVIHTARRWPQRL